MPNEDTSKANVKTVERVQGMLRIAQDEAATEEERRNSALKAVVLMKESDLQVISGAELSRLEKVVADAQKLATDAKGESRKNMLVGGVLGYLLGGGKKLW